MVRLVSCLLSALAVQTHAFPLIVNVFIGTTNGGHVFPGWVTLCAAERVERAELTGGSTRSATLPWGSVKVGADCQSDQNQAGYVADNSKVMGFSPLHDDGLCAS